MIVSRGYARAGDMAVRRYQIYSSRLAGITAFPLFRRHLFSLLLLPPLLQILVTVLLTELRITTATNYMHISP